MTPHILVAPAGRHFSAEASSENAWIYNIVLGVTALEPRFRFTCIAEEADNQNNSNVHSKSIGRRRTESIGGLALPLRVFQAARSVRKQDPVNIVHHALPFRVGRSFSVLIASAHCHGLPIVVGPVQTPLEWTGSDEGSGIAGWLSKSGILGWPLNPIAKLAMSSMEGVLARISAATLLNAHRVIVVGTRARMMIESLGVDPRRIQVIPPPSIAGPPLPGERVRGNHPLRVVTAGYLVERKAVGEIVTVVADLASIGEAIELEIVGDGPLASALQNDAHHHRKISAIRFHGWVDQRELARLVRSADVYVSMSRSESWGQAVADALSASLVVISADNVGARSMVEMGAPIRLVPVGDKEGLARQLLELCHMDPDALDAESSAGGIWASNHISVSVVAKQWAALYRQVIEEMSRV